MTVTRWTIPTLSAISDTALTRDVAIEMGADGLPNTFVPGRNLVFLTFAAALAYRRGITHIIGGMCETDYSGYPDCRDDTIKALQQALNLGMAKNFTLHTPLMWRDKAATWALAHELGGQGLVDLIREHSHTCYLGERGALARLGLWLRQMPGLRTTRQRLARVRSHGCLDGQRLADLGRFGSAEACQRRTHPQPVVIVVALRQQHLERGKLRIAGHRIARRDDTLLRGRNFGRLGRIACSH